MTRIGTITVHEAHGIRRFLYPLKAAYALSEACPVKGLGLQHEDGRPVPLQVMPALAGESRPVRFDFAVSMDPFQELKLFLCTDAPEEQIDDPLRIESQEKHRCAQRHFSIEFDRTGRVHQATYDGRPHLRGPGTIARNKQPATTAGRPYFSAGPLAALISAPGRYSDGCTCRTELETTACKSWAALTHTLFESQSGDEVSFTLPFAASSPVLTCDFGIGGGLYGKLKTESAPEITWLTDFSAKGGVHWSLATGGRVDYRGDAPNREQYRSQRWFHLIDRDKALAAAITGIPEECRKMTVAIRAAGDVVISFQLGEVAGGPASFGICYHFLNDIPALSAATNPQSILLPPLVVSR